MYVSIHHTTYITHKYLYMFLHIHILNSRRNGSIEFHFRKCLHQSDHDPRSSLSIPGILLPARSMIYVSFLFLVIALLVQLSALPQAFQGRQIWIEKSDIEENGHVITYEDFVQASGKNWTTHSPEAFFQYSRLIYTGMFAKILRQTSTMDLFEACANAFCQISRCICLRLGLR